jgi:hypothetical protein
MRVFLSSLRCFFFAIRLRRFLITEPTVYLSGIAEWYENASAYPPLALSRQSAYTA